MKKIAVLVCKKLIAECSGYRCFDAFNQRSDAFSEYDHQTVISGFFSCNGCDDLESEQMALKFRQLEGKGVTDIHLALCVQRNCTCSEKLKGKIPAAFHFVEGTHT